MKKQNYDEKLKQYAQQIAPFTGNIIGPVSSGSTPADQLYRIYLCSYMLKIVKSDFETRMLKTKSVTKEELEEYKEIVEAFVVKSTSMNLTNLSSDKMNFWGEL